MDKLCRVTRQKWHIGTWPMMDLWRQQSPRAFILPILLFESRIHTHNSHHLEFVCKTDISWSTSHLQFQSWYIKEESQAFGDLLQTILVLSRCSQQLPSNRCFFFQSSLRSRTCKQKSGSYFEMKIKLKTPQFFELWIFGKAKAYNFWFSQIPACGVLKNAQSPPFHFVSQL